MKSLVCPVCGRVAGVTPLKRMLRHVQYGVGICSGTGKKPVKV